MPHKKFGPDRFSRFDVYWIQTDRQTNKQTSQIKIFNSLNNFSKEETSCCRGSRMERDRSSKSAKEASKVLLFQGNPVSEIL